jgi:transcriptional regulator with XRE-family HTH domain|nr:MAG TPA: helix-turn-helix domain protein [Caudoviricetes sp.]
MPKRDTVRPNMNSIAEKVSAKSWSEASFSQMVGKHKRWLSEVRRDKNLPSPKEAAKMCVLLQVNPEDILLEQADIELVRGLLENEKAPGINAEGLSAARKALLDAVDGLTDEQCEKLLGIVLEAKRVL